MELVAIHLRNPEIAAYAACCKTNWTWLGDLYKNDAVWYVKMKLHEPDKVQHFGGNGLLWQVLSRRRTAETRTIESMLNCVFDLMERYEDTAVTQVIKHIVGSYPTLLPINQYSKKRYGSVYEKNKTLSFSRINYTLLLGRLNVLYHTLDILPGINDLKPLVIKQALKKKSFATFPFIDSTPTLPKCM